MDPQTNRVSIQRGGALESQAVAPPVNDAEMAHETRDWGAISRKLQTVKPLRLATNLPPDVASALQANPTYPALFTAAFGTGAITSERIAFAIATYQRTLVPDATPWDRGALTTSQSAGRDLFFGKAGCAGVECHEPPHFTDFDFRNTGVRPVAEDIGRMRVTNGSADRGRFKIPGLRNTGLKNRFMHNGGMTTLEEVVAFYNRGGDFTENEDTRVHPLNLTALEQSQIVDFLRNGLTDPRVAAGTFPFDRPTLFSESSPPGSNLYGDESAGTGSVVPRMLAHVPSNLQNPDFKIGISRALGGSFGFLVLSGREAPAGLKVGGIPINVAPDQILLFFPAAALAGSGAGAGFGTVQFPIPDDPSLAGATVFTQWFVPDAAAGGFSATKGARHRL